MMNLDAKTVEGFGYEWSHFDQTQVPESELQGIFELYFTGFPWKSLAKDAVGFDIGCGSGRWARFVAPQVGKLYCFDPSPAAVRVAQANLKDHHNCSFVVADAANIPLPDESMDFGYSLGVLHHVPDTQQGIRACVRKLKPGAPFLVYLYYAFDNRPAWFRSLWRLSDGFRRVVCSLPFSVRWWISLLMACSVYWPLARGAALCEKAGWKVDGIPLSIYRRRSFYTMRTDAYDRFATRLERRFTAKQIEEMMTRAGLENVQFSPSSPYWCAWGFKSAPERRDGHYPVAAASARS